MKNIIHPENKESNNIIGGLKRCTYLGIRSMKITISTKSKICDPKYAFEITGVIKGSPAYKSDLRVNDIIIRVNGGSIDNLQSLAYMIDKNSDQKKICLEVLRGDNLVNKEIEYEMKPLEDDKDLEIIYTSFVNKNRRLRIIITKPKSKGDAKLPAIFFIQGITCMSIDFPFEDVHPYKKVLYQISKAGFVTVRFERSGTGDSEGIPCKDIDFNTEKDDYDSAIKFIEDMNFIDIENIFIFGYSIGGVIAPILFQKHKIKGIVVFGTLTNNLTDYILRTMKRQRLLNGADETIIQEDVNKMKVFWNLLLDDEKSPEEIIKLNKDFEAQIIEKKYILGRHYSYLQQLSKIKILDEWENVNKPVLIILGKADYQADFYDHQALFNTLKEKNTKQIVDFIQPNIDHEFHEVNSMKQSFNGIYEKAFCDKSVDMIIQWLQHSITCKKCDGEGINHYGK